MRHMQIMPKTLCLHATAIKQHALIEFFYIIRFFRRRGAGAHAMGTEWGGHRSHACVLPPPPRGRGCRKPRRSVPARGTGSGPTGGGLQDGDGAIRSRYRHLIATLTIRKLNFCHMLARTGPRTQHVSAYRVQASRDSGRSRGGASSPKLYRRPDPGR